MKTYISTTPEGTKHQYIRKANLNVGEAADITYCWKCSCGTNDLINEHSNEHKAIAAWIDHWDYYNHFAPQATTKHDTLVFYEHPASTSAYN